MYDWAASAMQTTIMVAVFPIYFVKVAGAGLAESGATQRLATVNTVALVIIAVLSPILGRDLGLSGNQEAAAGPVHVDRGARPCWGCSSSAGETSTSLRSCS